MEKGHVERSGQEKEWRQKRSEDREMKGKDEDQRAVQMGEKEQTWKGDCNRLETYQAH